MTNFVVAPADATLDVESESLAHYQFGTMVAKHYFCKRCGIFTFAETRLNPGQFRFNLGCIDGIDLEALRVETFDGDSI